MLSFKDSKLVKFSKQIKILTLKHQNMTLKAKICRILQNKFTHLTYFDLEKPKF